MPGGSVRRDDNGGRSGRGGSGSSYGGGRRSSQRGDRGNYAKQNQASRLRSGGEGMAEEAKIRRVQNMRQDAVFGFEEFVEGEPRVGWCLNMLSTSIEDSEGHEKSAVDLYFLDHDGGTFRTTLVYHPYFYVAVEPRFARDASVLLQRKFEGQIAGLELVDKEDLDMKNHLSGKQAKYCKLSFRNVQDLMDVRAQILPVVERNRSRAKAQRAYAASNATGGARADMPDDFMTTLTDIREYDVPYVVRASIDHDLRVGGWYEVTAAEGTCEVKWLKDMIDKAEPRILAFDIECTKAPLKFPDAAVDQVFMISYMLDGEGFLIIARDVVSEDIEDFEYTPRPEFPGHFTIFNEKDEKALLRRFFDHVREVKPHVWVTYNGDFFDWPFIDQRCDHHGMSMYNEIGVRANKAGEYRGRCSVHMDAFCWVKRDSYLPQGAHGLKAVTKYKLGYDPVEVDPEDMVRFAKERPTHMASYSVSDAVATYYLYQKYVHQFVFSLCTIIPMGSEDVLRKGSGTLCESLLMVEAYRGNIICPNKMQSGGAQFHDGHLLETETYVGGHVECLETGVFRTDLPIKFRMDPTAFDELINDIDRALTFAIEVENGGQRSDITNYDEVRADIIEQLEMLRDTPTREEEPTIYHLDVAAMYPNIILTNRLQPCAIVDQTMCAACDFNREENGCKRPLEWVWRGDHYPATKSEYKMLKTQLDNERFPQEREEYDTRRQEYVKTTVQVPYHELDKETQKALLKKRMKIYSQTVYKKVKVTKEVVKTSTTCMRENPFYVNTVRAFRDRRYDYKLLTKKWKKNAAKAEKSGDALAAQDAKDRCTVFDSLQLAHKCILNSFYGYVMRRGARWYSMDMAGIVTYCGANLITQARKLVERIGRPLELDTDGIWCVLPASFPENFVFRTRDGGKMVISYPCVMLNADVHEKYTNHQYQDLVDPAAKQYSTKSECSIYFEVDGPYRCMVLPASTEEGKLLKKRYAVFNFDGSLAELKGFELKRRGELGLIKTFQSQVFELFLNGTTLDECYSAVAECANHWVDVLDSHAIDLDDDELMELISENRSMSKSLAEYGETKSTAICTAKRLGEFLGADMVKDAGLNCKLIISKRPVGKPVSERAIPVAIWGAEEAVKRTFLRKWTSDPGMENFDPREVLDWDYYRTRFASCVQKIITIPAAMQKVSNPVPRVQHPDWLEKMVREKDDRFQQRRITSIFKKLSPEAALKQQQCAQTASAGAAVMDIEDMGGNSNGGPVALPRVHRRKRIAPSDHVDGEEGGADDESSARSNGPPPQISDGFEAWHADRKARWRKRRLQRRRLRAQLPGERAVPADAKVRGNMQNFLKQNAEAVNYGHWQIIEVREASPGSFDVWAMTSPRTLQRISIDIPRTFYVNSRSPFPEDSKRGRKVVRMLPRAAPCMNLYEVSLQERQFQRNEKEMENFLSHPDVQGVYEMQTPLVQRALMKLGCVAQVSRGNRNVRGPLALSALEFLTTALHPYLQPDSATLRRLFIYHCSREERSGTRGMVALFVLRDTSTEHAQLVAEAEAAGQTRPVPTADALVWLVNPARKRGRNMVPEVPPNVLRIFRQFVTEDMTADCTFEPIVQAGTLEEAFTGLSQQLSAIISARKGPTVASVMSMLPQHDLLRCVPALNDLPMLTMNSNEDDSNFPALGWQTFAVQRMVQRFLNFDQDWEDRLQTCRYAHLPVGNLRDDMVVHMADIQFARLLEHNKHLLWMSNSAKPDLGGAECDENELWVEEHENPKIVAPGVYRSVCVEFSLHCLAVNTILVSSQLQDLEGAEDAISLDVVQGGGVQSELNAGADGGTSGSAAASMTATVDDAAACIGAFRLLKTLVTNWFRDVSATKNPFADTLLVHFYRWLCAQNSVLREPALHRVVHRLMKKLFLQLIAEFRALGADVIYADFNRIIIDTKKTDHTSALEYYNYIISTICARDIFTFLQFEAKEYWEAMLFLDPENFAGVKAPDGEEEDSDVEQDDERDESGRGDVEVLENDDVLEREDDSDVSEQSPRGRRLRSDGPVPETNEAQESEDWCANLSIVTHWNMADFLPEEISDYFRLITGEFLLKPLRCRTKATAEHDEALMRRSLGVATQDSNSQMDTDPGAEGVDNAASAKKRPGDKDYVEEKCFKYVQDLVSKHITKKLLTAVQQYKREYVRGAQEFPEVPGMHLKMNNAPLEFVKMLCHVLGLDVNLRAEVNQLRRSLLMMLNVRAFSSEAQFRDPCSTYVMPDIICSFCNYCHDLDLCRDPGLTQRDDEDSTQWRCAQCGSPYDRMMIEQTLVENVQRQSLKYQLQDLRCSKTRETQACNMALYSSASKKLDCEVPADQINSFLETMQTIAAHHNFPWLAESVDWLLQVTPVPEDVEGDAAMAMSEA